MNLYDATIPIFIKHLKNVEGWLDKAAAYAETKKVDPTLLLQARLAIDQYPLMRQVQAACDQAKFTAAKMTGKEPESHPDTEQSIGDLKARIQKVVAHLETYSKEDFANCEDRPCTHSWMGGKTVRAGDYLDHFALPNFHFHLTTTYSILRHNAVPLGKMDYIGSLPFQS